VPGCIVVCPISENDTRYCASPLSFLRTFSRLPPRAVLSFLTVVYGRGLPLSFQPPPLFFSSLFPFFLFCHRRLFCFVSGPITLSPSPQEMFVSPLPFGRPPVEFRFLAAVSKQLSHIQLIPFPIVSGALSLPPYKLASFLKFLSPLGLFKKFYERNSF